MTFTCVSVTSGNASIGNALKAAKPPATKRIVPRTMNSGFCSANATMRLIIGRTALSSGRVAAQLALETMQEKITFSDHLLAELDARGDARHAVPHGVDLHSPARVTARLLLDEDVVVGSREQKGLFRDLQVGVRGFLELGRDEH